MLKIAVKVMLTVNSDMPDRPINGQTGRISHNEFSKGTVWKVYANFSEEHADLKAMRSIFLGRHNPDRNFSKERISISIPQAY